MMMTLTSTDNKSLEKALRKMATLDALVKVGVVGKPEGQLTHGGGASTDKKTEKDSKGKVKAGEQTIGDIAIHHEFGAPKASIPERSFLRSTANEQEKNLRKVLVASLKMQAKKSLNIDTDKVLSLAGVWMVGKIKKKFTSNNWPALKNPSRARTGKTPKKFIGPPRAPTPLVDTGQLRGSISYEIVKVTS